MYGPPVTTRFPFAVHLVAAIQAWLCVESCNALFRILLRVEGLGLYFSAALGLARSTIMLMAAGLDPAIAEYITKSAKSMQGPCKACPAWIVHLWGVF